ncbi:patatin-like phospholipase family protein [Flavicella marina]|uniref:patatin-like phospholipase family protein n=1 Tax=Flavicella marina TaxID=1475951 RepID=UPI001264CBE5|nr:patatin-like phospholipase family protein [Flavicella marina]
MSEQRKKTVSLILGSGGARGLAHIGVIQWLEKNDFEITSISGCSIGSLIGGVYAAGKLEQLTEWMLALNKTDIASLLDFSWGNSGGIFKGDKIINTLIGFLEDIQIEQLSIPFTAVATDLITEKEVWINSGSLFEAIRASISLPLFFTPVPNGDAILIDGGVLNPVPIAPTFNNDTDITVAVNLGGIPQKSNQKTTYKTEPNSNISKIQDQIKNFLESNNITTASDPSKSLSMYEVADRAFDTMQSTLARQKIAAYPPDIEIEIARNACGTLEFDKASEMIALGFQKAQKTYENFEDANF